MFLNDLSIFVIFCLQIDSSEIHQLFALPFPKDCFASAGPSVLLEDSSILTAEFLFGLAVECPEPGQTRIYPRPHGSKGTRISGSQISLP